jgi:hypothetical protein
MPNLTYQRCFNHAMREAVARCPECKQFFCRECVVEHDDRVLCNSCLKKLTAQPLVKRLAFAKLFRVVQFALGLLLAWFFFFVIGASLLKLPTSFHEGTMWQAGSIDKE